MRCIRRLTSLLPPHLAQTVAYAYIKNEVLFFVVTHPFAKMEIDNITTSIKAPLKLALRACDESLNFNSITVYTKFLPPQQSVTPTFDTVSFYKERSKAEFENNFTNPKLYELMESIRKIIDAKHT